MLHVNPNLRPTTKKLIEKLKKIDKLASSRPRSASQTSNLMKTLKMPLNVKTLNQLLPRKMMKSEESELPRLKVSKVVPRLRSAPKYKAKDIIEVDMYKRLNEVVVGKLKEKLMSREVLMFYRK